MNGYSFVIIFKVCTDNHCRRGRQRFYNREGIVMCRREVVNGEVILFYGRVTMQDSLCWLLVQIVLIPYQDSYFLVSFLLVNAISVAMLFKLNGDDRSRPFYLLEMVTLIYLDIVWLATTLVYPGIASEEGTQGDV